MKTLLLAIGLATLGAGSMEASELKDFAGRQRVLVVFFADCTQRDTFERLWAGAAAQAGERDLVILRADGALRAALGIGAAANEAVLVGKDGGVKARWKEPVAPAVVFALIDTMPMRRAEMATGEARRP